MQSIKMESSSEELAFQAANAVNRKPRILLRSSWQIVNIGDIAHTPGVLALMEKYFPDAEVILWASENLSTEVANMLQRRFQKLRIVKGWINESGKGSNQDLSDAIEWCDFLLHGSGPYLVACDDVAAFIKYSKKAFGVFGITYRGNPEEAEVLSKAKFIYFRDSVSLAKAKEDGILCPVMEFGPDGAFAVDLRDDTRASAFLRENELEEGAFLCCIPRLRHTPFWKISDRPFHAGYHSRNEEMKEHDHAPLRDAIVKVVRQTKLKVLICPEDMTQMEVGKEMLLERLPSDVRARVVWRQNFWLTDEAVSVYIRSAGLFGNEMHSPIMCIGNGIPAIVCRWEEQTSKGFMWKDIGLEDWFFDMDKKIDVNRLGVTVLKLAQDPFAAKAKAAKVRSAVEQCQRQMIEVLKKQMVEEKQCS